MGMNQRFHKPNTYYLEHIPILLNRGVESGTITKHDKRLIEEFMAELVAVSQISPIRRYKLVGILVRLREHLSEPYADSSITDVYTAIESIKSSTDEEGNPRFKLNTIYDYIRTLKRFFVWMVENEYSTVPMTKLSKIQAPRPNGSPVTAEQILSEEEVKAIIEATTTLRDRTMLSVLYEGGFRIGEIGNMRWCDVKFTDWGVTVNTAEKTGKPRYVRLVASKVFLAQWKENYPLPITDDSFVFLTTTTKEPLQYDGVLRQIRVIAKRAGIQKHIKPHIFRHSRVTHLIQQGVSESTVKLMLWGDTGTNMLKTYGHLTNKDIDNEIAKLNGIQIVDDARAGKKRAMKPIQCSRCATINPPTAKYCAHCGLPLVDSAKTKAEAMESDLTHAMQSDPSFMGEMFNVMREMAEKLNVKMPEGAMSGYSTR